MILSLLSAHCWMRPILSLIFISAGLALLAVGGDVLVRGSVRVASALGVSKLLAGLVVVGFGTSTPELATSLIAAFRESPGLVLGNVIGSNVANILLILGVAACAAPLATRRGEFKRDTLALLVASFAGAAVVYAGVAGQVAGALLAALLVAYIVIAYLSERRNAGIDQPAVLDGAGALPKSRARELAIAIGLSLAGIAATILGAHLLVNGAIEVATRHGISEAVIGLTVVAIGTSLPELVACTIAALRRHPEVAIGNVLGSNIYNLFGVLGVTALIHPVPVPPSISHLDVGALLASAGLLAVFLWRGIPLGRATGTGFLLLYVAYMASLVFHG